MGARIAGRPGLESKQEKNIFLCSSVQTSSAAQPDSYPMDTGG
jgi:hypothetical protein